MDMDDPIPRTTHSPLEPEIETNPSEAGSESTPNGKKSKGGRGAPRHGTTKHLVEVTLAIAETKGLARDILASASSTSNEPLASTALAVVTNLARVKSVVSITLEVATAEPMESGIVATMCANEDPATFKQVWSLASVLNPAMGSSIPSVKAKAGLELAKALQSIDDTARSALRKAAAVVA
jgi:hypothetical protein